MYPFSILTGVPVLCPNLLLLPWQRDHGTNGPVIHSEQGVIPGVLADRDTFSSNRLPVSGGINRSEFFYRSQTRVT